MRPTAPDYVGRFAPTPSGPLHFGSLVAALASYLDAKSAQGQWLLRIEDIDPPREQAGASDLILSTLDAFELHWDGEVFYQSQQTERYQAAVDALLSAQKAYYCQCSRKQLQTHPVYPNWCRDRHDLSAHNNAVRLKTDGDFTLVDRIQGECHWAMAALGDFIIQRRDGLFAYQLAVVLDDAEQGVNQVVRGYDILDSTPRQLQLIEQLNEVKLIHTPAPDYAHIPVIIGTDGQKLSKQNLAPAISPPERLKLLQKALLALGLPLSQAQQEASYSELLHWAVANWNIQRIKAVAEITEASLQRPFSRC
ncbi:glutamyl-Q tRNA(Asp) synthetase [Oceanospirillum multiglobuliferum]|uniref:Glutamyl-Q tRNA(Asp) synthetase n=1 Tax=Oceanospirillum multiglobuliferum TaxID=64969 RepID=A0A1T4REU3_9GAMM|nr:tRNA glutamyl-Q(34) synthetase GluQRS [Oceanospirillum multiglobuliferum]OPX54906.1 tRNA glutamyl-Q(34) synthetase GluQRS [Oceanospirillum multiglobuliferum]SKA14550.1 glutamyl-Q tRNA(Asp) synthetase [Oceanospirillum multiglobuliferum]